MEPSTDLFNFLPSCKSVVPFGTCPYEILCVTTHCVLTIQSYPRTRMLVSKTDTTISLSSLTSDSTRLTAASNSVVLFNSWQWNIAHDYTTETILQRQSEKTEHNYQTTKYQKEERTVLTTKVSRVSMRVKENLAERDNNDLQLQGKHVQTIRSITSSGLFNMCKYNVAPPTATGINKKVSGKVMCIESTVIEFLFLRLH